MPMKIEREYRDLQPLAPAEAEEKRVSGYATTFNQPYLLWRSKDMEVWEQVDPHAFDQTDMTDVIMQYDHEGRVFARTRNHTLQLRSDEHGLMIDADLGGTEIGRQLYEEIRGGYTDKMSFGFTVKSDDWLDEQRDGYVKSTRTIKEIGKLYDVSAVSIPANDATEISVKSLRDGVSARLEAERLERERLAKLEEKRAALRQKIGGQE